MNSHKAIKIINKTNGAVIGDKVKYAGTFFSRLKGLLFYKSLSSGEGLLLYPCSSVHSFGMKIPIDVVFLDQEFHVLKTVSNMGLGLTAGHNEAKYVLEMAVGIIEGNGIKKGDIFTIEGIEN